MTKKDVFVVRERCVKMFNDANVATSRFPAPMKFVNETNLLKIRSICTNITISGFENSPSGVSFDKFKNL